MDQDALEKRLAEIFGSKAGQTKHQQTTVDIDNPAFVPPGQPGFNPTINPKLTVTEETWTDADGNALKIQRWPDGTMHETGAATAPAKPVPASQAGVTGSNPRVPAGSIPITEGTPIKDAQGNITYDNTQPIRAWHNPDGTITYEPLQPSEVLDWERKKNGGLTDEEVRKQQIQRQQPASKKIPVDGHPGIYAVTAADPNNPNAISTHYENEAGQTVPQPPDAPSYSAQQRTINGKVYTTITKTPKDGSPPTITNYGPDGQSVTTLPQELKPAIIRPNPVTGVDEQVQEVPDGNGGVKLVVKPIEREGGNPAVPTGAPEVDLSTPDNAYSSFMRLYQWATQQVATGKQTPTWLENTLKGPHEAVTLALNQQATQRNEEQRQTGNALTQRAQDITQSGGRLSAATSGFNQALDAATKTNLMAGPGINAAASTLLGTLALQRINAQQMGGMESPAPVVPGPMNSLPSYTAPAASVSAPAVGAPASAPVFRPAPPTNVQPAAAPPPSAQAVAAPAVARPPAPATTASAPDMRNSSDMNLPPGTPAAAAPAGNERPDDWLDVQDTTNGQRVTMRRSEYDLILQQRPEARQALNVVNAMPSSAITPRDQPLAPGMKDTPGGNLPAFDPHAVVTVNSPGATVYDPVTNPGADDSAPPPPPPMGSNDLTMTPGYGMPTMALASTFGRKPAYDQAIASMKAAGLSDEAIQAAMANHLSGVAA